MLQLYHNSTKYGALPAQGLLGTMEDPTQVVEEMALATFNDDFKGMAEVLIGLDASSLGGDELSYIIKVDDVVHTNHPN